MSLPKGTSGLFFLDIVKYLTGKDHDSPAIPREQRPKLRTSFLRDPEEAEGYATKATPELKNKRACALTMATVAAANHRNLQTSAIAAAAVTVTVTTHPQ